MKRLRYNLKKIISAMLAVIMLVSIVPELPALAENASPEDGMNISLSWAGVDGQTYDWIETRDIDQVVTLRVSYSCEKTRNDGYAAGDIVIEVPGIGSSQRDGALEAVAGADKAGSGLQNRDWSYTYNKRNDTYTLTNNKDIEANSVLSGFFDLVWTLPSRDTYTGYEKELSATMSLPTISGDAEIESNTVKFTATMEKDEYSLEIIPEALQSGDGFSVDEEEYYIVKFILNNKQVTKARGLSDGPVHYVTLPEGAVMLSEWEEQGSNVYKSDTASYFYAAFSRKDFLNETITVSAEAKGIFHEEEEETSLGADSCICGLSEFDFTYDTGIIIDYDGKGNYTGSAVDETCRGSGYLNGGKLFDGETAEFTVSTGNISSPKSQSGVTDPFWDVELAGDFFYILMNNGKYRRLDQEEYSFKEVTIPGADSVTNLNGHPLKSDVYDVEIYASFSGKADYEELVYSGKWSSGEKTVALPEGANSFIVRINGIKESIDRLSVKTTVEFHLKEETGIEEAYKVNIAGSILSGVAFERIYDTNGNWITEADAGDYSDADMAALSKECYGGYVHRWNAEMHVHPRYDEFTNRTKMTDLAETDNGWISTVSFATKFDYPEGDVLEKTGLYTLLPEGMTFTSDVDLEEELYNHMSFSGLGLSSDYLANHAVVSFEKDYKGSGRVFLKVEFDFSDNPIVSPSGELKIDAHTWVSEENFEKYGATYQVKGVSMVHDEFAAIQSLRKYLDNGEWDFGSKDIVSDMDGDGNDSEYVSSSKDSYSIVYAESSQTDINKTVSSKYTGGRYVSNPEDVLVSYGGEYEYKLRIRTGINTNSNIVFYDTLENFEGSQWKGTLLKVDTSYAESIGFTPKVWYSASDKPGDLNSGEWSDDKSDVKSIAVDFGDTELAADTELYVIVKMKATEDTSFDGRVTVNNFKASFTTKDLSTGHVSQAGDLESNETNVRLTEPLGNLILTKVDAEDGSVLSGVEFTLYKGEEEIKTVTANSIGRAVFKNIPCGDYTVKETKTLEGYEPLKPFEITIKADETVRRTVENERKPGSVLLTKVSSRNINKGVAGAEYTLYRSDDTIYKDNLITDENGLIEVKNLPWGNYYFKEKKAPLGFGLNEEKIEFSVNQENVSEASQLTTTDKQNPAEVILTKYEALEDGTKTTTPLSKAKYKLYMMASDGSYFYYGTYVTDSSGEIYADNLAYSKYYFEEFKAPTGYELDSEKIFFELLPEDAVNDKISLELSHYNQRKKGTVTIHKVDDAGQMVEGARYELKKGDVVIGTYTTDQYGMFNMEELFWGSDYTLQEVEAPEGYALSTEVIHITVDAAHLSQDIQVVDQRLKGSVELIKYNEDGTVALEGAVYNLYKNNGTVVKDNLTTNKYGKIKVTGLEWGSYYFQEVSPPEGYALSSDLIRFTVNYSNAGELQTVEAYDVIDAKSILLTKKIKAEDIHFEHGNPTFIFKVTGEDIHGEKHEYHQSLTFTEKYVLEHTDSNGYISMTAVFGGLMAGNYTASEQEVIRYELSTISEVSANGTVVENRVAFDMVTGSLESATFYNEKYEWQEYSDTGSVVNVVKTHRKLTSLKAEYLGPASIDSGTEMEKSWVKVTAIYDDGTNEEIAPSDYTLTPKTAPNKGGSFLGEVSYTERGITKTAAYAFHVKYAGAIPVSLSVTYDENDIGKGAYFNSLDGLEIRVIYSDGTSEVLDEEEYVLSSEKATGEVGSAQTFDISYTCNGTTVETSVTLPIVGVTWYIDRNGCLYVNGKGEIPRSANGYPEWYSKRTTIKSAVLNLEAHGSLKDMFYGCMNMVSVDTANFDMSNANSAYRMFYNCQKLEQLDTSCFDMSNIETTYGMFANCLKLTELDVSNWDLSKNENAYGMFLRCIALKALDVSNFVMTSCKNTAGMFGYCVSLEYLDVSNWDMSKVEDTNFMFGSNPTHGEMKLVRLDVSNWDLSNVKNTSCMYQYCTQLVYLDVSNWGISHELKDANRMFYYCESITSLDVSKWDASGLENTDYMYSSCLKLEALYGISNWNLAKVISSRGMLQNCTKLDVSMPSSLKAYSSFILNHVAAYSGSSFTVSKDVTEIGKAHVFYDFGGSNFKKFIVEEGNPYFKTIDDCLYSSDGTRLIAIPTGKVFEDGVFEIPEGVTFINELAFSRCTSIEKVVIPNSYNLEFVETKADIYDGENLNDGLNLIIGIYTFANVKEFEVKEDNPNYVSIDGCIYSKDGTALVAVPYKYEGYLTIPEGVTTVAKGAVYGPDGSVYKGITRLEIPSSVASIDETFVEQANAISGLVITVDEENPNYTVVDGKLTSK